MAERNRDNLLPRVCSSNTCFSSSQITWMGKDASSARSSLLQLLFRGNYLPWGNRVFFSLCLTGRSSSCHFPHRLRSSVCPYFLLVQILQTTINHLADSSSMSFHSPPVALEPIRLKEG